MKFRTDRQRSRARNKIYFCHGKSQHIKGETKEQVFARHAATMMEIMLVKVANDPNAEVSSI